jgi:hypothetical protein
MQYVVKATGPTGRATWLTAPRLGGFRTFGPRNMAEVFETHPEAQAAMETLPATGAYTIVFSIELAE